LLDVDLEVIEEIVEQKHVDLLRRAFPHFLLGRLVHRDYTLVGLRSVIFLQSSYYIAPTFS